MRTLLVLLVGHAVLLLLASTNFSLVNWLWSDNAWTWNYFQYSHKNGWGYTYMSDYSLGQILAYISAYALGAATFAGAWLWHRLRLSAAATVLCLLGLLSFSIEATHWLWAHHLSWIASFPAVMLILWVCIGGQLACHLREDAPPLEAATQEDGVGA
jgi:hypothetical protein